MLASKSAEFWPFTQARKTGILESKLFPLVWIDMDAKTCDLKDEDIDRLFQGVENLSLSTDSIDL